MAQRPDPPTPSGPRTSSPRQPVPFTERMPRPGSTTREPRIRSRFNAPVPPMTPARQFPLWLISALGVPMLLLLGVLVFVASNENARFNSEFFTKGLLKGGVVVLAAGVVTAMLLAVWGKSAAALPLSVKIGAVILAVGATALATLFILLV